MKTNLSDERRSFLTDYKELCIKHGYQIVGCGECDSAWLQKIDHDLLIVPLLGGVDSRNEEYHPGRIQFISPDDINKYEVVI